MGERTILLVDDEMIILFSLKQEIEDLVDSDVVIETAKNASLALEKLGSGIAKGNEYLLVISDWLMPGMKGDEFLGKVREISPSTMTVLCTGMADENAIAGAFKDFHISECVMKPWSRRSIERIVADAFRGSGRPAE